MNGVMRGIELRRPVATVVGLYAVAVLLWQRDWLLSGEMYAEMATNYYWFAKSGSLSVMLFARDSGYWPLPQRLISDVVHLLGLNASTVPYAYTASAVAGAGLLAGSFAHPLFRALVGCDVVRVTVALLLLCSLDTETRGFINFTYLVVVFGAAMVALACHRMEMDVPWWCWSLPALAISKPHVLVLAPMAAVAAVLARGRMRWLMGATVAAGLVQAGVLARSATEAAAAGFNAPGLPLATKLRDAVYYGFGLAGGDVAGPLSFQAGRERALLMTGAGLCVFALVAWWRARGRAEAGGAWLMLAGLALVVGTGAFNALTLTTVWGPNLEQLSAAGIYRHRVTALAGALLFVAGAGAVLSAWIAAALPQGAARAARALPAAMLAVWLWATGSAIYPTLIREPTTYPLSGVGQWQAMAGEIDRPERVACVPIDPLGWSYPQGCVSLVRVPPPVRDVALADGAEIAVPGTVGAFRLLALGVSVKPAVAGVRTARLRATVEHAGGTSEFLGESVLRPEGVQVLLTGTEGLQGVTRVRLAGDATLRLFMSGPADAPVPTVAWMGR